MGRSKGGTTAPPFTQWQHSKWGPRCAWRGGVVSTARTEGVTATSGSSSDTSGVICCTQENVSFSAQETTGSLYQRPALDSASSIATSWFSWKRWISGRSTLVEGVGSRRGLSMKVGSKVTIPAYTTQPGLDAGVVAAADSDGKAIPDKILDLLVRIDRKDVDNVRAQEISFDARNSRSVYSRPASQDEAKHQEDNNGNQVEECLETPAIAPSADITSSGSSASGIDTPQERSPTTSASCCAPATRKEDTTASPTSSASSGTPAKRNEDTTNPTRSASSGTSANRKGDTIGGKPGQGGVGCAPVWKVAAILLARSAKSGYARRKVSNLGVLLGAITLMAVAFRQAEGNSEMAHLMASVLFSNLLPGVIVYQPLMIQNTWGEWPLTKTEIADGFYPPVCATMRMVLDHLACGVFGSFTVVGIVHSILWHRFISDLPASGLGVHIQLSCGATLISWVMISLFDALAISGLHLTSALSIGVAITSVWVFFSGTILQMSSIPSALRAMTYTSPHYWNSSFMLRVILDGLDMTADCEHKNPFYCATGFGDLVADTFGLHVRHNGLNLLAVALFALTGFAGLVITVEMKGRHTGILGGLGLGLGRRSSVRFEAHRASTAIGPMKAPKAPTATAPGTRARQCTKELRVTTVSRSTV